MKAVPVVRTLFLWVASFLTVCRPEIASSAAYPDVVLEDRPIAYWRLNEVNDRPPDVATNSGSVGPAGHGLYYGAPQRQQPGALAAQVDPAVMFDGLLQKLDVPHVAQFNPPGALTVELWAKATGGQGAILSPLSSRHLPIGQAYGYVFYTTLGNQWEFRTHDGIRVNRVVGGTVRLGAWTHLTGVYDGTATRLYVNGVAVGFPVTNAYAANTLTPLRIGAGANEGSGAFFWPGSIDEVAIYSLALSAARIAAHYQAGTNTSPALSYEQLVQADRPVGYWRLNEPAGGPLAVAANSGSLGAAANGTYQSGALPGVAGPGPPSFIGFEAENRACALDGTNGFISTMAGLMNHRGAFTITGWIKRAGPQSLRAGLFGQNDAVEFGYANDTTLHVRDYTTSTNLSATNSFLDGEWHHVAVVGGGTTLALYTNAVLAASAAPFLASSVSNLFRFNIGGGGVFDPTGNFFKGFMDEVAVFDQALGLERLAAHYYSAVGGPPRIALHPPARTNVYAGDPLFLSVTAVGSAPLEFQWYLNTGAVLGQTKADLVVNSLDSSSAGSYYCRVSNAYGVATSAVCVVTLLPPTPPTITSHPQAVTTYAGLVATFSVLAAGPALAHQWQANRVPIPRATNSTLVFSNVQAGQAADYRVIVSNSLGAATSAVATLTVLVPSPGSFAALVVSNKPLAYWRMNEMAGPTAFDFAGRQHATAVGQARFGLAGPAPPSFAGFESGNRAILFNGVDTWLAASNSLLNARSNFTMLGWISRSSDPTDSTGLWGQRDVAAFGFSDATTLDVWAPRGGQLEAAWPYSNHEWHFLAVVGTGADLRLYLDGALVAVNGTATANYGSSPAGFSIGGGGIFDAWDNNFDGSADEVAVFDQALSAGEMCRLYRAATQTPLRLHLAHSPGTITLSWPCGTLEETDRLGTDSLSALWSTVSGASSPFVISNLPATKFYRIRESERGNE